LLPLIVLVGTGLRGLDFGLHWDERPWQIGPVKHMVQAHTFLPGYYNYPSFDYWLNLLVLAPDAAGSRIAGDNLREHLLYTLDSHAYLLRLRAAYLLITSLTLVWVYLLVLQRCGLWVQALFAASLLGCSWEVAYHLRWVATDGMLMQFAALTVLLASYAVKTGRESWLIAAAAVAGLACGTKYPGGYSCCLWRSQHFLAQLPGAHVIRQCVSSKPEPCLHWYVSPQRQRPSYSQRNSSARCSMRRGTMQLDMAAIRLVADSSTPGECSSIFPPYSSRLISP